MNRINRSLIWFALFILILGITSCAKRQGERYTIVSTEGKYLISVRNSRSINYAESLIEEFIRKSNGGTYEILDNQIQKTSVELTELVPTNDEIRDWRREVIEEEIDGQKVQIKAEIMTYVGDEIFKDRLYAERELFLSYNFLKQVSIDYENPKLGREPYLRLDIYDMGTPEDAFGIYSVNRIPQAKYYKWAGDESVVETQRLYMWKGRYYIEIEAFEYADDIYEGMIELAKAVDKKISSKGKFPELFRLIPEKRLIRRSQQYFHEAVALKNINASLNKNNTLNLSSQTSGALAQYKHNDSDDSALDTVKLLLIKYPSQKLAMSAYQSYTEFLRQNQVLVAKSLSSKSVTFKK